jgi:hypothetical protein
VAQQVLHARVLFTSTQQFVDSPSIDLYWEATGSAVDLDFSTTPNPTSMTQAFFSSATGAQTAALHLYMSAALDRSTNACKIEYYDVTTHLNGSNAGSPVRIDSFTLGAAANSTIAPPGVSIVVGYRRDYGSDLEHAPGTRPRARDRGRIYFGPLDYAVTTGSTDGSIHGSTVADLGIAFGQLAADQNEGMPNQFNLVQWSRKNADTATVKWFFVDEGWTYQRRRGDDTANRVHTWTAVP